MVKGEAEQPVRTVHFFFFLLSFFVIAQKSIIVIILKALNISTFCHFILTFRQLYLFRSLTRRFFNSTRLATLQWWQLCCINRLVLVLSGEGRDQHTTTRFQLLSSFYFSSFFPSVWYFWHLLYSWLRTCFAFGFPVNASTFSFSRSTSLPLLSEQSLLFTVSTEASSCRRFKSQTRP